MTEPLQTIGVVIPTLGNRPQLARLLKSLEGQLHKPERVVIVNQGPEELVNAISKDSPLPLEIVRSERGLSRARNAGIAALGRACDAIAIADDDIWYEADAFEKALSTLSSGYSGLSGLLLWSGRSHGRLAFPDHRTQITASNVWTSSIEAGYVLRRTLLERVGHFDESLGIGSSGPWQSGEGTDLLLRALSAGERLVFDPQVRLWEDNPIPASVAEAICRQRAYARGTGRVYSIHYGRWQQLFLVAKSIARVAAGAVRLSTERTRGDIAVLLGRLEGLLSRR